MWKKTKVDSLAVAIGNAHGFYKLDPKLDFQLLKKDYRSNAYTLVLHGGTGIPVEDLRTAIGLGIRKINFFYRD